MAKGDWLGFLSSAILVVIPAPAHSGELTKADHAAFAIRPMGSSGDVKTRLWSGVNVAALGRICRLSVTSLRGVIRGKWRLSQPYFGSAKPVAAQRMRAVLGIRIGSVVMAASMIQCVGEDTGRPGSDLLRTRFMSRCRTVICGQDD